MNRSEILARMIEALALATSGASGELQIQAERIYLLLATIQLSWTAMGWLLERDDPSNLLARFVRQVFLLSLGYALVVNFRRWAFVLIEGFAESGRRASGLPVLDPSVVLEQGVAVTSTVVGEIFDTGLFGFAMGGWFLAVSALLIFIAFVVIAVQMLLTLVEAYFVLGTGVLFVGFAGLQWTAPIAGRLVSFAFGVGAKLFTVYLIVGVGVRLVEGWLPLLEQSGQSLPVLLEVLGASIVYAFLAWSIPNLTASMMNGAISLTLTDAIYAARAASASANRARSFVASTAASVSRAISLVHRAAMPTVRNATTRVLERARGAGGRAEHRSRKSSGARQPGGDGRRRRDRGASE